MRLFSKYFRNLSGVNFRIDKIYPSYRQGFNKSTNKMETFVEKDGNWSEKVWDGTSFVLKDGKPSFKDHKKVYDVDITVEKPMTFTIKDEDKTDTKLTFTLSAWMLGEIMKATVAFGKEIPQDNDRDKFDWEEAYLSDILGTTVIFSVTGTGIGTKYTFKEGKPFIEGNAKQEEKKTLEEDDDDSDNDDLPFN